LGAEQKPPAVRAGDRLKIRASTWNAVTDLLGDRRTGGPTFLTDTETRILVRNDTGGDVDRFGVVKIGDVLITPDLNEDEYANRRAFVGESPAAGAAFAVTQQPIPAGECGWAVVLGVTTCTLNVADEADTHASPGTSTADLDTGTSGPARILWKDEGTGAGVKAKVLLLGQGAGGGALAGYSGSVTAGPTLLTTGGTAITSVPAGSYLVFGGAEIAASAATTGVDVTVGHTSQTFGPVIGRPWYTGETNTKGVAWVGGLLIASASGNVSANAATSSFVNLSISASVQLVYLG
jgi:hypothetical protein